MVPLLRQVPFQCTGSSLPRSDRQSHWSKTIPPFQSWWEQFHSICPILTGCLGVDCCTKMFVLLLQCSLAANV